MANLSRLSLMLAAITLFAASLVAPVGTMAQTNVPPAPYAYSQLADPQQEQAAHELMQTIRCLQCQSQSIADSDAPIAGDMRHQIRTRIAAGEDPEAIRQWLVDRYGDYISYQPRVSAATWPLFAIPVILLLVGLLVIRGRLRKAK